MRLSAAHKGTGAKPWRSADEPVCRRKARNTWSYVTKKDQTSPALRAKEAITREYL